MTVWFKQTQTNLTIIFFSSFASSSTWSLWSDISGEASVSDLFEGTVYKTKAFESRLSISFISSAFFKSFKNKMHTDFLTISLFLFISEFLWLCRVAALKSLPVHPFNALIFPILRDCLQSVCSFLYQSSCGCAVWRP